MYICKALYQLLLEKLIFGGCDGVGERELMVGFEGLIYLLEAPVATFQEPLYQAALIIEARPHHYPVILQILFKPVILGLLIL